MIKRIGVGLFVRLQPAWFIDDDIREDNVRLVPA